MTSLVIFLTYHDIRDVFCFYGLCITLCFLVCGRILERRGIRKSFIPLLETKHPYVYVLFIYLLTVFFFNNRTETAEGRMLAAMTWF